jgi:hypothetical protein
VEHGNCSRGIGIVFGGGYCEFADGCGFCGGAAWGVRAGLCFDEKAGTRSDVIEPSV